MFDRGAKWIPRLASLLWAMLITAGMATAQEPTPEGETPTETAEGETPSESSPERAEDDSSDAEPSESLGAGQQSDEEKQRDRWQRLFNELVDPKTDDSARGVAAARLFSEGDASIRTRLRETLRQPDLPGNVRAGILIGIALEVDSLFDDEHADVLADFLLCAAGEPGTRAERAATARLLAELDTLTGPGDREALALKERRIRERINDSQAVFGERLGAGRIAAARQDLEAVPLLLGCLSDATAKGDDFEEMRRTAAEQEQLVEVLRQLTGLRLGPDEASWRAWWVEFTGEDEAAWQERWSSQRTPEILRLARWAVDRREREVVELKKRVLDLAPEELIAADRGLFDVTDPEIRLYSASRLIEYAERANGNGRLRPTIEAALPRMLARLDREGSPAIRELLIELLSRYGSQSEAVRDRLLELARRGPLVEKRCSVQALSRFSGLVVFRDLGALLDRLVSGLEDTSLLGDSLRALTSVNQHTADEDRPQEFVATQRQVGKAVLGLLKESKTRGLDASIETQLLKTLGAFPVADATTFIPSVLADREIDRWKIRLEAVRSVEAWRDLENAREVAVSTLLGGLGDPSPEVRLEILKQLALKHLKDLPEGLADQRTSWAEALAGHIRKTSWGAANEHELVQALAAFTLLRSPDVTPPAITDLLARFREPTAAESSGRFREAARCLISVLGADHGALQAVAERLAADGAVFAAANVLDELLQHLPEPELVAPDPAASTRGNVRWQVTEDLAALWLRCDDGWGREALPHLESLRAKSPSRSIDLMLARALEAQDRIDEAILAWRALAAGAVANDAEAARITKGLVGALLRKGGEPERKEAGELLAGLGEWIPTADEHDRDLLARYARAVMDGTSPTEAQRGIEALERLVEVARASSPIIWDWRAGLAEALLARQSAADLDAAQRLLDLGEGAALSAEQSRRFESLRKQLATLRQASVDAAPTNGGDHGDK